MVNIQNGQLLKQVSLKVQFWVHYFFDKYKWRTWQLEFES